MIKRKKTRVVKIGNLKIGGDNPVVIQSMIKVPTKKVEEAISQIQSLKTLGCSIVRVALKDEEDARAVSRIKKAIAMPLVADIHFDWRLAVLAIKAGADKIRLNPGNIYKRQEVEKVVGLAKDYSIPIRVGLNSGSLPKIFKYDSRLRPAEKMLKAAFDYIRMLEGLKFRDIVVSLKCSDVTETIEVYQRFSKACDYPLHLGLTATGSVDAGKIKSAVCLGVLLIQGIGDTVRVSLTARPEDEVMAARDILASLGLGNFGPEIISCPTCGRTEVDIEKIVNELRRRLSVVRPQAVSGRPLKLAVMGCVVNGPGEAEEADLAVAFGKTSGLLYRNSKPIKKVSSSEAVSELIKEWKYLNKKR